MSLFMLCFEVNKKLKLLNLIAITSITADTVNIYYAFLTFPSLISGILAEFAVSFSSLRNVDFTGVVILPMVAVLFLSLLMPILITMWYQPELCILTRLEHQWRLRLRAVAGSAIPIASESFVPKEELCN